MSLIHHRDQVPPDTVALTCHGCRVRFAGVQLEDILCFDEDLRCPDCGLGGMIAHRAPKVEERFPWEVATPYTPLPEALMDRRLELDLGPHDLLVVWALERHRRTMGDTVHPSLERLSDLTGLSRDQVKRATRRLVASDLITRTRSHWPNGRKGPSRYGLDPLWQRLADLENHGAPVLHGEQETDGLDPTMAQGCAVDHGAKQDPTMAHQCAIEVDTSLEVDALGEVDPIGHESETRDAAPVDPRELKLSADFDRFRDEHPRLDVLGAWALFTEEREPVAA